MKNKEADVANIGEPIIYGSAGGTLDPNSFNHLWDQTPNVHIQQYPVQYPNINYPGNYPISYEPTLSDIMREIQNLQLRLSDLRVMIEQKLDKPEEKIDRRKLI